MRWVVIVVWFVIACKKKEPEAEPAPAPSAPSVGHSRTKVAEEPGAEPAGVETAAASEPAPTAPGDAAVADAPLYGGNGKPAYRDEEGHVHPPGGPVYMGTGPDCTDKIDHCLRPGVWFAAGNVKPRRLYRATPVFEFENKWWTFRGEEATDHQVVFKTKVVENPSELQAGSPVVWLVEESSGHKWLNSEHDALTSSRWEVGVIESVAGNTFTVGGWTGPIPIDTARVITQRR